MPNNFDKTFCFDSFMNTCDFSSNTDFQILNLSGFPRGRGGSHICALKNAAFVFVCDFVYLLGRVGLKSLR